MKYSNKVESVNMYIARLAKPKNESEFRKVLQFLYIENNETKNEIIRLMIDQWLSEADWQSVNNLMNT